MRHTTKDAGKGKSKPRRVVTAEGQRAADQRKDAAPARANSPTAREKAVEDNVERDQLLDDLKSANERLVIMSLRWQELADVAEEAQRRLEVSERELRSGIEFRERLIGIVSHDLRNPLGAIRIALDMLARDHHVDADGQRLTNRIRGSIDRMVKMIVQLLDFTRAHAGVGIPIDRKPCDLERVCRLGIEELELRHSMLGRFRCEFQGDLNGIWDADRLTQVISNLGGNAIEHGPPETAIDFTVSDRGEEVLLEMHNHGGPIPPEKLPFIFDAFRQGREESRANGGSLGLGLGLYISDQIVRGHGGSITVRSTAADGTTFSIRLPRHPPKPTAKGDIAEPHEHR